MNKSIKEYIIQNSGIILKILIVYLISIAIGFVIFKLNNASSTEYINNAKELVNNIKENNVKEINVIANGLKNNVLFVALIYSTMLTIISPLLVFILIMLKGITTGIYMCALLNVFGGLHGLVAIFFCIILIQAISFPGYIQICISVLSGYNDMIVNRKVEFGGIVKQIYSFIISFSLISFSIVMEQVATSLIFKICK